MIKRYGLTLRILYNLNNQDKPGCHDEGNGIMSRITLTDLDAVMAIARRGTFRAAAIELGVSTTALSHIIARFEAEMGVRLFNRTTRS
ncbi:helix-turn-helix domain-containing protein, partial [Enterobacter asburiae]